MTIPAATPHGFGLLDTLLLYAGLMIWIGAVLFSLASHNNFRVRLAAQHREVWMGLGLAPLSAWNRSSNWVLDGYLMRRRYLDLRDPELTRWGNRALIGRALTIAVFLSLAAGASWRWQ